MRDVSPALRAALEADVELKLVPLVTLGLETPVYRAGASVDIEYDGNTFLADGVAVSDMGSNIAAEKSQSQVTLQNIVGSTGQPLPWSQMLRTTDLNGVEVTIDYYSRSVGEAITWALWFVSGYELVRDALTIRIASILDPYILRVPRPPLVSNSCLFRYLVAPCASESSKLDCGHTFSECVARFPEGAGLSYGPSFPGVLT